MFLQSFMAIIVASLEISFSYTGYNGIDWHSMRAIQGFFWYALGKQHRLMVHPKNKHDYYKLAALLWDPIYLIWHLRNQ